MQNMFLENKLNPRTKDICDEHVDQLTQGEITMTDCGIKRPSILMKLPYFHPTYNESA